MPIFTVNMGILLWLLYISKDEYCALGGIHGWDKFSLSGTKLGILMSISTFTICKPHTDTAVNFEFHRLA